MLDTGTPALRISLRLSTALVKVASVDGQDLRLRTVASTCCSFGSAGWSARMQLRRYLIMPDRVGYGVEQFK
jgi:hypothetical protein